MAPFSVIEITEQLENEIPQKLPHVLHRFRRVPSFSTHIVKIFAQQNPHIEAPLLKSQAATRRHNRSGKAHQLVSLRYRWGLVT